MPAIVACRTSPGEMHELACGPRHAPKARERPGVWQLLRRPRFSLVIGILFGELVGAVSDAMTHGRRDSRSVARTSADRYQVLDYDGFTGEAAGRRRALTEQAGVIGDRCDAGLRDP